MQRRVSEIERKLVKKKAENEEKVEAPVLTEGHGYARRLFPGEMAKKTPEGNTPNANNTPQNCSFEMLDKRLKVIESVRPAYQILRLNRQVKEKMAVSEEVIQQVTRAASEPINVMVKQDVQDATKEQAQRLSETFITRKEVEEKMDQVYHVMGVVNVTNDDPVETYRYDVYPVQNAPNEIAEDNAPNEDNFVTPEDRVKRISPQKKLGKNQQRLEKEVQSMAWQEAATILDEGTPEKSVPSCKNVAMSTPMSDILPAGTAPAHQPDLSPIDKTTTSSSTMRTPKKKRESPLKLPVQPLSKRARSECGEDMRAMLASLNEPKRPQSEHNYKPDDYEEESDYNDDDTASTVLNYYKNVAQQAATVKVSALE